MALYLITQSPSNLIKLRKLDSQDLYMSNYSKYKTRKPTRIAFSWSSTVTIKISCSICADLQALKKNGFHYHSL
jgi:hypothetical protein